MLGWKEKLHTDPSDKLPTGKGLSWGCLTEGIGEEEPPPALTLTLGATTANINGRE